MNKILILEPFLKKISNGVLFNNIFSWLLKIFSGLTLLVTLWVSWKLWSNLSGSLPPEYFISALVAEIFLLAAGFVVFNILLIRANDIRNLPSVKIYVVTPVFVLFIRTLGEVLGSLYALLGLAIGLSSLLVDTPMLPIPLPGLTGAFAAIIGSIVGFFVVAYSYVFAEALNALVDIARNTKKRRP